ncbi:histone family protein nucleoid-structuring protein H-NS [Burkholderia pseudomallei]|nr:histone family protein nucleoid-structuring protein H-NS [Burkholderia pseudomallei]
MPTLEAIETKIRRLQEQAEAIKAKKASATLDRIFELMQRNEVTVADIEAHLGGKKRGRPSKKTSAEAAHVAAKYMDPKTGATWSGRGRAPVWIANAKDRSRFSIASDEKLEATVKTTLRKAKSKASSTAVSSGRKGQPKGKQPAKYQNPETGATWSGRGPAPAWLAAASDRSKFLIDAAAIEATTV